MCCGSMLNVVMSPSKLSHPRQHVYAGRVGVITSYLSLAFGYAHAWTDPFLPQGFSMGLSVVGVLQLMFTTGGLLYIRQALRIRQIADALRPHDEAAREAAVREVNRWTEPTPSLLLVFKFHMPPLLTDLHGRPAERLDSRSASHEEVVANLREVEGALTSWHTTAMVALFYGACCGPFFFRVPHAFWQLLLPDKVAPDGLMFAGLVPSILLPQVAALAIKENRWYSDELRVHYTCIQPAGPLF